MGKVKTIYRILVPVLVVLGMALSPFPAMETASASSVSSAWVELSDGTVLNSTDTNLEYIIHFTAATALSGGRDTITVSFPNGTTEMAGEEGSGYAFSLPGSIDKDNMAVDPDGAATETTGYTDCYTDPDVGTYRVRLTVPEDIAAGASPYVRFETGASITSAAQSKTDSGALCFYRVKVETSQDTVPVYSEYFYLGSTAVSDVDHLTGYPDPATVGAAAGYRFEFTAGSSGALSAGSGTITVIFPSGTTVPASASPSYVQVDADGSASTYSPTACTVAPACHTASRTVTLTVPQSVADDANVYVYFDSGFGLVNPTESASAAKIKLFTSAEPKYAEADTGYAVTAGTATKLEFADKSGAYSDDATMINMYSSTIYLQLQDGYGNIKAPASDQTASLNSTSDTGRFYSAAGSQISSATIYDGTGDPDGTTAGQFSFLYKDTTAGTHTITASAGSYTPASWTITVAPAVALYDTSNELVGSYSPTSTAPVAESASANSGDYLQDAISDALPGETVRLGDGTYELDTALTMAKAITLESASGAAVTTLRPTTTLAQAIAITATGSATYGVTIDGITLARLRSGTVFTDGIYNSAADYFTIQNCVFSYIYNQGIRLVSTSAAFTQGTISNNTFTNGGGDPPASTDAALDIRAESDNAISGITISGNTITGQKGRGIYLAGQDATYKVSSVTITGNTITSATSYGVQGDQHTATFSITGNTITGGYDDGIYVYGTAYTIKKNVLTDNLGDGIDVELTSSSHLINYNDIYDNTGYGVYVLSSVSTVNAKYNWWGDASGPTYTAATGASVTVSNPEGTGENITDRLTYYEWLYKPVADVIADNAAYYSRAINLNVGWNTLSAPIILDESTDTVGEVVDLDKVTIAYWYDAADADDDDSYWEQVTADYTLAPCDAIYIKMNATDSVLLKYNAVDISLPTRQLYAGWNLIGLASLDTKHVDDAVQSVANTPENLPGYSQVISPSMNSEDWTFSYGQSYTDEDMLVGEGYWIYMQNDCTLVGFTVTPIEPSLD
jgi:parallel beta-helix repeat protein